jgi:hypothetical protein
MILGFKDTFVSAVADGTKPHTIRSGNRWKVGQSIQFYRNVRQSSMTKIRPNGVAKVVQAIKIERPERFLGPPREPRVFIDGRQLTPLECQELSRRDGFQDFDELLRFISQMHGFPFIGQLVCWTDLRY